MRGWASWRIAAAALAAALAAVLLGVGLKRWRERPEAPREPLPLAAPPNIPEAPRPSASDLQLKAQQRYLSGVIYFQKGDYARASGEWEQAQRLDPSNQDVRDALLRLDRIHKPSK